MVIFVKCEMRRARSSYNEKNPARKRLGYIYYYKNFFSVMII